MRILVIAMSNSIHTARWISQIADRGWDIHLFPSIDCGLLHPDMKNITVYQTFYAHDRSVGHNVTLHGIPVLSEHLANATTLLLKKLKPGHQLKRLVRLIGNIRPDIIHSLEIQAAGYLTMEAKRILRGSFPPWIVTNWGSDIYFFRRFPEHEKKIREVLSSCDYYTCECERDVALAHEYGLKGRVLSVMPNAGGIDLGFAAGLRRHGATSARRVIMLKGYHSWAGRALVGLQALESCVDLLSGYTIAVYSVSPAVAKAGKRFEKMTGIRTKIIPKGTPHAEILGLHGSARLSIGLSVSDGLSTSFLEAMAMGSFPIQSWTACADEWIEDGKTGLLVPPEDPLAVAQAIRHALTDDEMVDHAAEKNYRTVEMRLDHALLKHKATELYAAFAKDRGIRNEA